MPILCSASDRCSCGQTRFSGTLYNTYRDTCASTFIPHFPSPISHLYFHNKHRTEHTKSEAPTNQYHALTLHNTRYYFRQPRKLLFISLEAISCPLTIVLHKNQQPTDLFDSTIVYIHSKLL